MKKILLGLNAIALITLTSCFIRPTPKLVDQYKQVEFKATKALHHEFTRTKINETYSYVCDFYHGENKEGNFFRIYKNDNLFFERTNKYDLNVNDITFYEGKIYFILSENTTSDYKSMNHYSVCSVDDSGNCSTLYDSKSGHNISNLTVGRTIRIQEFIDESVCYFHKINEVGEISDTIDLSTQNITIYDFEFAGENLLLYNFNEKTQNSLSVYDIKSASYKSLFSSSKNIYFVDVSYVDKKLDFRAYESKRNEYVKLYSYSNEVLTEMNTIKVPDDYSYYINSVNEYSNKLFIDVNVGIKDASKSLYSRVIYLIFDIKTGNTNTLYLNKNANRTVWGNDCIYIGSYNNDYVEGSNGGDFDKIKLNEISYQ